MTVCYILTLRIVDELDLKVESLAKRGSLLHRHPKNLNSLVKFVKVPLSQRLTLSQFI